MSSVISIKGLSVSYERKRVLSNIFLELQGGSIYGVIGPNGAGKSTLFKTILDIIQANTGTIKVFDQEIDEVRKRVAYVPQKDEVDWSFPATVMDIVLMGRYPHKKLDEPFVGVDITTESKIIEILKKLSKAGKTMLVVHHDLATADDYFDQVILLNQRLIAYGPTNTIFTRENIALTYASQLQILQEIGMIDHNS